MQLLLLIDLKEKKMTPWVQIDVEDNSYNNLLLVSFNAMAGPSWGFVLSMECHQLVCNSGVSCTWLSSAVVWSFGIGVISKLPFPVCLKYCEVLPAQSNMQSSLI